MLRVILISVLMFLLNQSMTSLLSVQSAAVQNVYQSHLARESRRLVRQTTTRPGFFQLVRRYFSENANDTNQAYHEITNIISNAFSPPNPREGKDLKDDSVQEEKLDPNQIMGFLRRSYRGLQRLFNRQFREAISQSSRNVDNYVKEFRAIVTPYLADSRR